MHIIEKFFVYTQFFEGPLRILRKKIQNLEITMFLYDCNYSQTFSVR